MKFTNALVVKLVDTKDKQIVFKVVEPIRKDPNRGMRFVNCSEPVNRGRLGHSKAFLYKANKTYKYYD